MTQIFSPDGHCVPVTVIQVERCVPVLKRTPEVDGYQAVLVAYGQRKAKHTNKPLQGFYQKYKLEPARLLTEFRDQDVAEDEVGQPLSVEMFGEGDRVNIVGVSKGKGFAGVMKRHGFHGMPASRGTHESFRGAGSIGMHTYPGRVHKGKSMPGRGGAKKCQVKNQKVVRVDKENNLLLIQGAVPGGNGGIVRIIKSKSG